MQFAESAMLKLTMTNKSEDKSILQKMNDEYSSMHRKQKKRIKLLKQFYNRKLSLKSVCH